MVDLQCPNSRATIRKGYQMSESRIVPREAIQLTKICPVGDPRYQLDGVHFEPMDEKLGTEATVTDGHRLIRVRYPGFPISEFPEVSGFEPNGFRPVTVPTDILKSLEKTILRGRKVISPLWGCFAITAHPFSSIPGANIIATMASTDGEGGGAVYSHEDGEKFPNYRKVIPPKGSPNNDTGKGFEAIGLNIFYVSETLAVLAAAVGLRRRNKDRTYTPQCLVSIPKDNCSPVRFDIDGPLGTGTAVIMPMRVS